MLYLSILIILIILIISKAIYKNFLVPPILMGLTWLIALFLLRFSNLDYNIDSIYFLYFTAGIIIFNIGFITPLLIKHKNSTKKLIKVDLYVNQKLIKLIILFEAIYLSFYVVYVTFYFRSNYLYNFYFTLKLGKASRNLNTSIIGFPSTFVTAFTSYITYIFAKKNVKNINNKRTIIIVQYIIGLAYAFFTLGRTALLLFIILNFSVFLIISKVKNKIIIKYSLLLGILWFIFFSIYNILKYPYSLESKSFLEASIGTTFDYLTSSIVAFIKWASSDIDLLYGENTFRFIKAVLNKLGFDTNVQSLVNPFIRVSTGKMANVYTFYYFYAIDFGLIYALFMQLFLGILHGILYKKLSTQKPFWIYMYSLSLYPLLLQFFQDQYISLTSMWLQYTIYGLIIYKSGLFLKYKKI